MPLAEKCVALDPSLEGIVSPALDLTRYAVEFRCPGELEEPTVEEALEWLAVARTVLAEVVQRLPQEPGVRAAGSKPSFVNTAVKQPQTGNFAKKRLFLQ